MVPNVVPLLYGENLKNYIYDLVRKIWSLSGSEYSWYIYFLYISTAFTIINHVIWYEKKFKIKEISYILCKTEVGQWGKVNETMMMKQLIYCPLRHTCLQLQTYLTCK